MFAVLVLLGLLVSTGAPARAFYPGPTFEDRRRAYIEDQGRRWEGDFPDAMRQAVFAWLEAERMGLPDYSWNGKSRKQLISEEIGYLTSDDCNLGYENCWFTGDHPTAIIASRIYYQYYQEAKVISDADAAKIREKINFIPAVTEVIMAQWCGVANFHFRYLVAGYLYASRVENAQAYYNPSDPDYGCPPPSFSYNGRTYRGGNYYDARAILGDYLNYEMDDWVRSGTEEDLSTSEYFSAQLHSIALLADFSPDPALRQKAKMLLDWLFFHYAVGFSAGHLAGGHGRHYVGYEFGGQDSFPFAILYNLPRDLINSVTRSITFPEFYVMKYRHPGLLTEIVESLNGAAPSEGDDYYRIIRGHTASLGNRYDYITPNYNLGGAGFGTGWELNIRQGGERIKLFICEDGSLAPDQACNSMLAYPGTSIYYLFALGMYGNQHRNALFYEGPGHLHQVLGRNNSWDEQSEEGGWKFFRKGKVAVAVRLTGKSAGLEVATLGVDYPSYGEFKDAIRAKAVLADDQFTTTRGVTIGGEYVDLGPDRASLPFDRLEVWEGHVGGNDERKLVDWENNVMSVSRNGLACRYDFNNWTTSGNGCGTESPPLTTFADVPLDHWAHNEIQALYDAGFTSGCALGPLRYCPNDGLKRTEAAVFVDRGLHGADFAPAVPSAVQFGDLPLNHWAVEWVDALWQDGMTSGCQLQPLLFCPERPHTRAESVVFLERVRNGKDYRPAPASATVFDDVPPDRWYNDWVHAADADGLLVDCEDLANRGDRRFRPEAPVTRAEMACMMVRAKGLR